MSRSANEVEELFRAEFPRLVRVLAVAFDADVAADAVQEAFVEANRIWSHIRTYADRPHGFAERRSTGPQTLADLTVDDVANALGTSAGTVKSNLRGARNRLRTTLREERHE